MIKIKAYKCIVTSMLFCPAFLTGCSGEKGPLEQDGERELLVENCFSHSDSSLLSSRFILQATLYSRTA